MSSVALVTDSTAYLPSNLLEQYKISVIPLYVRFGEEVFRDNVDMTPDQFYRRLQTSSVMPATSQPSAGDFMQLYQDLIEQGASTILSIHISSKLSGTISSAMLAREQVSSVPIHIVDSASTSMGLGFLVLEAARALEAGQTLEQVVPQLESLREAVRILFVVDTLEFLHKGGRIGGAQAFLGSMLSLKPLLAVRDGQVDAVERVRTKRRAVQRMLDIFVEELGSQVLRAAILQAAAVEEAEVLRKIVGERLNCQELLVAELSPAIGTHAGPGTVGLVTCPVLGEYSHS